MVVMYKGEKFIGKVANVVNGQAAVQCLTKPLGINTLEDFEYVLFTVKQYTILHHA